MASVRNHTHTQKGRLDLDFDSLLIAERSTQIHRLLADERWKMPFGNEKFREGRRREMDLVRLVTTAMAVQNITYQGHPVWVSWLDYPTLRKQASIGHPLDVLGRYCNRLLNLLPNQWILLRGIIKCVLKLDQREGLLYAAACSLEKVPGKKRY